MGGVAAARDGTRGAHNASTQGGDGPSPGSDMCTDLSGSNSFSSYSCDGNCIGPGGTSVSCSRKLAEAAPAAVGRE